MLTATAHRLMADGPSSMVCGDEQTGQTQSSDDLTQAVARARRVVESRDITYAMAWRCDTRMRAQEKRDEVDQSSRLRAQAQAQSGAGYPSGEAQRRTTHHPPPPSGNSFRGEGKAALSRLKGGNRKYIGPVMLPFSISQGSQSSQIGAFVARSAQSDSARWAGGRREDTVVTQPGRKYMALSSHGCRQPHPRVV